MLSGLVESWLVVLTFVFMNIHYMTINTHYTMTTMKNKQ